MGNAGFPLQHDISTGLFNKIPQHYEIRAHGSKDISQISLKAMRLSSLNSESARKAYASLAGYLADNLYGEGVEATRRVRGPLAVASCHAKGCVSSRSRQAAPTFCLYSGASRLSTPSMSRPPGRSAKMLAQCSSKAAASASSISIRSRSCCACA